MATRKTSKKTTRKTSSRRYGDKAAQKVARSMHEMKRGKLRSSSGQKVTNPRQAIAIGLSEARRAGGKVASRPKKKTKSKSKRSGGMRSRSRSRAAA